MLCYYSKLFLLTDMEIKDLTGLSEPLTRLIEVISSGIGAVSASHLTRKNADAKAHEIRVISEALNEVAQQYQLPVVYKDGEIEVWQKPQDKTLILDAEPIEERLKYRLEYQARKEQKNIESVTSAAAIELNQDEAVASESPDEDWVNRFFKYAQDISSDQMQDLWGRILAGEVRRPGTYSLRTLEFVKNMTKAEARLIEQFGNMAISLSGTTFVGAHNKSWLETERDLPQGLVFQLAELDVMYPSDLSLRLFREDSIEKEHLFFHDRVLVLKRNEVATEIKLTIWKFTTIGQQLLPLVPPHQDDDYLEKLGLYFVELKAKAFIAQITKRHPDGKVDYEVIREIVKPESSPEDAT